MAAGVYAIKHLSSGKIYVGSSVDIHRRKNQHFGTLRRGVHFNLHLQRAWDKYGDNDFQFIVLLRCSTESLLREEQKWIDALKPAFNILPTAGSPRGYEFTPEHCKNISLSAKRGFLDGTRKVNFTEESNARAYATLSQVNRRPVCHKCGETRTLVHRKIKRQVYECRPCDRKYQALYKMKSRGALTKEYQYKSKPRGAI